MLFRSEFRRAGIELDLREDDERLQSDDCASDVEEVDGFHSLNHNDDEMDMITNKKYKIRTDYTFDGNSAASWLNLPSKKYCAINGINATYMPTDMVTINTVNLDLGNMDFNEMTNEPEDVGEEKMKKMI